MPKEIPLVSVPIVTYNSSKTIVETLDSVYNQTYPNIELIVSDDCSTDNTVFLVEQWLSNNKSRFVRTELLTTLHNTGISANYNRAAKACHGEWVKDFDGDDIMLPHCIQTFINYVSLYPDTICAFSKIYAFRGNALMSERVEMPLRYDFFQWPIEKQYHFLVFVDNQIPAPTCFYNREKAESLGIKNDERIPMLEDWPKWINYLKKNVRFHFIDEELVLYRLSESSISNSSVKSDSYNKSLALFYLYYQYPEIMKEDKPHAIASYVSAMQILSNKWYWRVIKNIFAYLIKLKKQFIFE